MNAKFVFAVFLALQVSLTLCEIPAPEQELMDKYNSIKMRLYKRITNAYEKMKTAVEPLVEKASAHEHAQGAREAIEQLHSKPEMGVAVQLAQSIGEEVSPAIDKLRSAALGFYGHYLRAHIGEYLNDGINRISGVLDQVLPVED